MRFSSARRWYGAAGKRPADTSWSATARSRPRRETKASRSCRWPERLTAMERPAEERQHRSHDFGHLLLAILDFGDSRMERPLAAKAMRLSADDVLDIPVP